MSEGDQHVHRFLWRDLQTAREPDHYVLTAVPFGDRPSGTIAMTALHTIAKMHDCEHPDAANAIINNTYVDDLIHSCSNDREALSLAIEIQDILAQASFKIKHWVMSSQVKDIPSQIQVSRSKQKVLGVLWNPEFDEFSFEVTLNFSLKSDKHETKPKLTIETLTSAIPQFLTKRLLLRQVAAIFDPLGLITPFMVQGKLLMRSFLDQSQECTADWDVPMPAERIGVWLEFFKDMFEIEHCRFPRCIKPSDEFGNPTLIVFSDASSQAYGACAYVRWQLKSGEGKACLVASKNRIAPTRQLTIPRLELCAAVMGCRLGVTIQKQMSYEFSEILYVVDSIIVRSQIQKESYTM